MYAPIPKGIWPFALPKRLTFELTFHWSEITTDLGEPLFAFCASLAREKLQLDWPLFRGEAAYPGYAWTRKARDFIEEQRRRRREA
jgi:hypothetical protein